MVIRVLLADDHRVITDGLTAVLSLHDDLTIVGTASGGRAAVTLCAELQPDVVLMDLSMPDMDGVEATRTIVAGNSHTRIIALTGFFDEQLVGEVLAAGASGYLLKSISGADLARAIRDVVGGRAALAVEALPGIASAKKTTRTNAQLTAREIDVLERISLGESNKEIAQHLGLSPGTVRGHVSNILAKLGVQNRTAAARYANRNGFTSNDRR